MTEGTPALGAPPRVEGLAVINAYVALSRAMLRLGQIARLHHAEAARALSASSTTTTREVADAWISVNAMLTKAVDELTEVEATMASQIREVAAAVGAAETDVRRTRV